eukprot:7601969-Heterocapsa_arctica.AAC.1
MEAVDCFGLLFAHMQFSQSFLRLINILRTAELIIVIRNNKPFRHQPRASTRGPTPARVTARRPY